ncbi:nucleotidyltransferase family protein [Amycolatopsis viridis]|uniref:Polymerase nucleotidyl transferase domain-containing protein n=1 Tax=Amycolatopsis viridis TaxID=185678 RepID=A0ABX0T2T8_9PSEU|nr:nucleotidyltransferase domain-containing protein [Amycolatopsis viridis]NIH82537.1 hypothetical protein [Amycolatopsis viridis]
MTAVDEAALRDICARYGIAELLVFGSAARGGVRPSSDIDIVYELQPGARLGWEIEDLNEELAALFGRPVDLVAKRYLNPLLRDAVLAESRPLHAA